MLNKTSNNFDIQHIDILNWIYPIFQKGWVFVVYYGGRGAAKTEGVARALLILAMQEKHIVLCARQFHVAIKDSVYATFIELIDMWGITDQFKITRDSIIVKQTGSKFLFKGLHRNKSNIKSIKGITLCWVEEGESITRESWDDLVPSIRGNNDAKIICTFNARYKTDCLAEEFILSEPEEGVFVKKVGWRDNPYFPAILDFQRKRLQKKDIGLYNHVWEGEFLENSEAQIFNNRWMVDDFEVPDDIHMYYGLDFGTRDPTAAVACFIKDNTLYIAYEAGKSELDIDYIGEYCKQRIPNWGKEAVWADSSRPDTISFLKKQGYNIKPADKGKGSVEDGISHIKSYDRVVIHSRCIKTIEEFTLYSYKVDERSGEITAKIVDAYNHYIDAIRYALNKVMKKKSMDYSAFDKYALYN